MTRNQTLKSVIVDPRKTKSSSPVRGRQLTSSSETRRSRSRSQDSDDAENPGNNLFVRWFSRRITESDLRNYFSKEGKVVECRLKMNRRLTQSLGYGFVTMETNDDAERCIKILNDSVFEGRLIKVEKAKRSRCRPRTPGTFVGSRNEREQGSRPSRSWSLERWQDRDYSCSNQQGGSRSPQCKRNIRLSRSPQRKRNSRRSRSPQRERNSRRSLSPHSRRKEDHS